MFCLDGKLVLEFFNYLKSDCIRAVITKTDDSLDVRPSHDDRSISFCSKYTVAEKFRVLDSNRLKLAFQQSLEERTIDKTVVDKSDIIRVVDDCLRFLYDC